MVGGLYGQLLAIALVLALGTGSVFLAQGEVVYGVRGLSVRSILALLACDGE